MSLLSPVGPIAPPSISLSSIPQLGLGGATFSLQFNPFPDDEATLPVQAILRRALSLGINLIDTSPYYGNSEIVLGRALRAVFKDGWKREGMFICTKVGRVKIDQFDYARESVRKSVLRSIERLGVQVLDVVYCHDVEFVTKKEVMEALSELYKLRDEGKIRYIGISGLPVRLLVELAQQAQKELPKPLDVILSYSHMTLQNSTLEEAVPKFQAAGVQKILTASPLSMGLLRSAGPHPWHPATEAQKTAVVKANQFVEGQGQNFADTCMRFVFAKWSGTVVGGWSSVKELEDAVEMWHRVKNGERREQDEKLWKQAREVMGKEVDTMWPSPESGWVFNDGTRVD